MSHFAEILQSFTPISLKEMEAVELMNRKDTKYFFDRKKLDDVLEELQPDYKVMQIDTNRFFSYKNIYFDTPEFACYTAHHNKRVNRYKIRIRQYVESNLTFLEIKFKINTGRTIKSRISIPAFDPVFTEEARNFLTTHTPFDPDSLQPTLWNDFKRFTLVSKSMSERATIDTDLHFKTPDGERHLHQLCIAELKLDGSSSGSKFKVAMRENFCPEARISKYSVGAAFMYEDLKQNNFKFKKIQINRIENA